MLEGAKRRNPNAMWWVKADGCDLVQGLKQSTRLIWSGDVDLDNGKLQEQYCQYRDISPLLMGFL